MSEPLLDVVTLGEALALFMADAPGPLKRVSRYERRTAGAETNVAVGLARQGLRVGWASRLGDDSLGRFLRAEFAAEGVDVSHAPLCPGERTGLMFKTRNDDGGDPAIEYHRAGSAASRFGPGHLDLDWLRRARHLHVSGVFPALGPGPMAATRAAMAAVRAAGGSIGFDPNLRPALWPDVATMREAINDLARGADWVLPGLDEGRQLTGRDTPEAIAAFYLGRGARAVAVKLGPDGAWVQTAGFRGHVPAAPVARVVDTVGAGDAFAAGWTSACLADRGPEAAARRAVWCGAQAVQARGDTEGLPTRAQVEQAEHAGHGPPSDAPRDCDDMTKETAS